MYTTLYVRYLSSMCQFYSILSTQCFRPSKQVALMSSNTYHIDKFPLDGSLQSLFAGQDFNAVNNGSKNLCSTISVLMNHYKAKPLMLSVHIFQDKLIL